MHDKYQVLGTSPFLLGVIHDIVFDDVIAKELWVYSNLDDNFKPQAPISPINYIFKKKGISPSLDSPIIFGVSGSENKIPVFEYYLKNHNLKKSKYSNLIHSSARLSSSCNLAQGVMIEQNVVVSAQTSIGFGVSIKRGSLIGHHCIIGDFVDINPGVVIAGKVVVEEGTTLGIGCKVLDGVKIGRNSVIGAGSIVTKEIPENVVAYGSPCKIIRKI